MVKNSKFCDPCLSRRAATRLGVSAAALTALASCGSDKKKDSNGDSGTTVTADANGIATLDFTKFADLRTAGGSYRVNINGKPISVTRVTSATAVAVLAECTHEGAILGDDVNGSFTCPRHGATFKADGTVTSGPASTNLTTYSASITSTAVQVIVP